MLQGHGNLLTTLLGTVTVGLSGGCGEAESGDSEGMPVALQVAGDETDLAGEGVRGTLPSRFVVAVSGCRSGYSKVHDSAVLGPRVALEKGDWNCVVALRSLVWKGESYTKSGGGDFSGAGMAVFVGATSGKSLFVENPERLSANPVTSERVTFHLRESLAGANWQTLIPGARGEISSSSGGLNGPFLTWAAAPQNLLLTNVSASPNLFPTFQVKLQCQGTWTAKTPAQDSTCKVSNTTQTLNQFYLRIVPDSYANGSSLTWMAARNLFGNTWPPSGIGVVAVDAPAKVFPSGTWGAGGVVASLTTNTGLLACRSFLAIVLRGNSNINKWSFTYFNVDFATANATCP